MSKGICVSLFDYTGVMLAPWRDAGYLCYNFDIQHDPNKQRKRDGMVFCHMDLLKEIPTFQQPYDIKFVSAFPPCDHLAVSGARWFRGKGLHKLAESIKLFAVAAEYCEMSGAPYMIENPVSTISTYWRKPDHTFDPYEYGGYIEHEDATHPQYPEYITAYDAYPKKTCLWVGGGFIMPSTKPVNVGDGYSTQHQKLGGKSMKTKNIRSATPRGFAKAVFEANHND